MSEQPRTIEVRPGEFVDAATATPADCRAAVERAFIRHRERDLAALRRPKQ